MPVKKVKSIKIYINLSRSYILDKWQNEINNSCPEHDMKSETVTFEHW